MLDNIRADFKNHGRRWGAQGFWAMAVYRYGRWCFGRRNRYLRKALSYPYHFLFKCVQMLAGIELPCEVKVGHNFIIDHFGGIVISGYASFGDNCRIRNGVVIGLAKVEEPCAPRIGNNVDVGAGAKLLGPIRIGDNVCIGANAVVIDDVPDDCIAVGVPAVCKRRRTAKPRSDDTDATDASDASDATDASDAIGAEAGIDEVSAA